MQSTDDDLHCIRYSLHMPALAAVYVIALTRSTIALEKNGCPLSLHLLEVLFVMYFKN